MKKLWIIISFLILAEGCALRDFRLPFSDSNIEAQFLRYIREEQYEKAESICVAWLEEHSKDWSVQSLYGVVLMFKGDYARSIDEFEIALPHLEGEKRTATLVNLCLARLYKGDLLEFCETVDILLQEVGQPRRMRYNEKLISAIALFIQEDAGYRKLLSPIESGLFTKSRVPNNDQRIIQYWRKVFTFKADERDKRTLVRLIAKRPVKVVLPQTTLSSFVVAIIAEKSNPTYLKPIIAYGR